MAKQVDASRPRGSAARWGWGLCAWLLAVAAWAPQASAFDVALNVLPQFSQNVGDRVSLSAVASNTGGNEIHYQFSVRESGGVWRVIRDFDTTSDISWGTLDEGSYELRVVAVDQDTPEEQGAATFYAIDTRIVGANAEVNTTVNPLVTLYSVPPCTTGGFVLARFKASTDTEWTTTPFKGCDPGKSINFYLAGQRANSTQIAHHVGVIDGVFVVGQPLFYGTGALTVTPETIVVVDPPDPGTSLAESVQLWSYVGGLPVKPFPLATNLAGEVLWYNEDLSDTGPDDGRPVRPIPGGNMLYLLNDTNLALQRLAEIDLAGNIVRETSVRAVNTQLEALGLETTNNFHHDALLLPNGHTVVLGSIERLLTDVQGSGEVDIYADTIYVLDENYQLVWIWNPFDHLDATEQAILGETCTAPGGIAGCPPIFLAPEANDWLHVNSLYYTPEDGNLIFSARHLDAVFKIDYADGAGDGHVVWRLGRGGDFTLLNGMGTFPWFSHQHFAHFKDGLFLAYDNGNTRVAEEGGGNSRAQVYLLDEVAMTAQVVHNFGLGHYSPAVGAIERLSNGNIVTDTSFLDSNDFPFLPPDDRATITPEVRPDGTLTYLKASTGQVYRSWRMKSLYEPSS